MTSKWKDFLPTETQCSCLKYNTQKKVWLPANDPPSEFNTEKLHVVTYNIFFAEFFVNERFDHTLKLLQDLSADIVCLQEVIPTFVSKLINNQFIQETYYISDCDGSSVKPYGVMMLFKVKPQKFSIFTLPSEMGRKLLLGEWTINGETIQIGTVHLESLSTRTVREKQLEHISRILSSRHSLLVGDFNFDSDRNFEGYGPLENEVLKKVLPQYIDVWEALYPGEKGYTYDSLRNKMIKKYERMRYDRILLKITQESSSKEEVNSSTSSRWMPSFITLFGDQPINILSPQIVFPSDHFGMHLELLWQFQPH